MNVSHTSGYGSPGRSAAGTLADFHTPDPKVARQRRREFLASRPKLEPYPLTHDQIRRRKDSA